GWGSCGHSGPTLGSIAGIFTGRERDDFVSRGSFGKRRRIGAGGTLWSLTRRLTRFLRSSGDNKQRRCGAVMRRVPDDISRAGSSPHHEKRPEKQAGGFQRPGRLGDELFGSVVPEVGASPQRQPVGSHCHLPRTATRLSADLTLGRYTKACQSTAWGMVPIRRWDLPAPPPPPPPARGGGVGGGPSRARGGGVAGSSAASGGGGRGLKRAP